MICGGDEGYLELFKGGEFGNLIERLESGHDGTVDCVRSVRGFPNLLLSASATDGTVRLTHLKPNRSLATVGSHEDGVAEISISDDGRRLVSCGDDGHVRAWDLATILGQIPATVGGAGKKMRSLKNLKLKTDVSDTFFDALCDENDDE